MRITSQSDLEQSWPELFDIAHPGLGANPSPSQFNNLKHMSQDFVLYAREHPLGDALIYIKWDEWGSDDEISSLAFVMNGDKLELQIENNVSVSLGERKVARVSTTFGFLYQRIKEMFDPANAGTLKTVATGQAGRNEIFCGMFERTLGLRYEWT